ncbi:hypothetical protein [Senegalia massiliensis]|uniref:hypothetical protein n=1 Tax=Senegalia massiliensis TaxID=1720316 RepID=UPI0010325DC6|nr:hypothetical protein [Senegalia massiliensis]
MRTIISMAFLTILYLGLSYLLGVTKVMFILSATFFIMATLFSYNKQYYDKYFMFINPKQHKIIYEKHERFRKKHRLTSIISFYILSIIMFINGTIGIESNLPNEYLLTIRDFIIVAGIMLIIGIIVYFTDSYILKKSKYNKEYIIWSILLSLVIVGIVFVAIEWFVFI